MDKGIDLLASNLKNENDEIQILIKIKINLPEKIVSL